MADLQAQVAKQLANIEATTGRSLASFAEEVNKEGLEKHGQILKYLKTTHGLGHGNANLLAAKIREARAGGPAAPVDLLSAQYSGGKAHLRPIHDAVRAMVDELGDDVKVVVQKTAVSFRRKKQFALIKAASSKRVEMGLNLDETPAGDRVVATKGMCNHKSNLTAVEQVDDEVRSWLQAAYTRAG